MFAIEQINDLHARLIRNVQGLAESSAPHLSGNRFRSPGFVRRAHVGKFREQVFVRTYLILRHLSIGEKGKEEIYDVVAECAAIVRVSRRPRGIIVEDVREQGPTDPGCFRWRISTGVLQRVREDRDETGIVRGLRSEIGGVLLAGKERSLIRPRTAIRLNPFPAGAIQRANP